MNLVHNTASFCAVLGQALQDIIIILRQEDAKHSHMVDVKGMETTLKQQMNVSGHVTVINQHF